MPVELRGEHEAVISKRPLNRSDSHPVGDIESMLFIKSLCQLSFSFGPENFCFVYVIFVPVLGGVGEQKTKLTQHSV